MAKRATGLGGGTGNTFISTNPSIHIEVQRALRGLQKQNQDLQNRVAAAEAGLKGKVDNTNTGLLAVSQFVQQQLQASGAYPLPVTSQVGHAAQPQASVAATYKTLPIPGAAGQLAYSGGHLYIWSPTGTNAWVLIA